jgi:Spy/CpxP family protein refolding chaperone
MSLTCWIRPLCLGVLLLSPALAPAQPGPPRDDRPPPPRDAPGEPGLRPGLLLQQLDEILGQLELDAGQREQIERIRGDTRDALREVMQRPGGREPRAMMEEIRAVLGEADERVLAVLDERQKPIYREHAERVRALLRERLIAARRDGPATRPTTRPRDGMRPGDAGPQRPGMIFQRLRDEAMALDLSDEQKRQMEGLFESLAADLRALRDSPNSDRPVREQIQRFQQRAREGMMQILTPEQQRKLREAMADAPPPPPPPMMGEGDAPPMRGQGDRPPGRGDDAMNERPMNPDRAGSRGSRGDGRGDREGSPATAPASSSPPVRALPIGSMAPDLKLTRLDGKPLALSSLKGKPTLLVFGSYSSPHFRQRAGAIEALRKEYAIKLNLVVVYTREAHPAGEWDVERNRDERISIPQHASLEERLAQAKQAAGALALEATMVVDEMEQPIADRFGAFPNGAVLLDRDGKLVARQRWVDPSGLRDDIDAALARPLTR